MADGLRQWEDDAQHELERLRRELADERARGRAQAAELEAAVSALRAQAARASAPAGSAAGPEVEVAPVPPASRPASLGARFPGFVALGVVALFGFALRPYLLPGAAPSPPGFGPRLALAAESSPADASAALAVASTSTPAEVPRAPVAEDAAASAPKGDAEPTPAEPAAPSRTGPPPVAEPTSPAPVDFVAAATFAGRLTARAASPFGYATVDAPPCVFFERVHSDASVRATLGPCMGPWCTSGASVAGTHRVAGQDCCKHHQLVQRLGGDLTRLELAARVARDEGVLPPLMAARIDRAVALFLRSRFGRWRSAGVDEIEGAGHRVRIDSGGIARIATWIEVIADDDAPARRLTLALSIELGDGPEGDTLLALDVHSTVDIQATVEADLVDAAEATLQHPR